MESPKGNDEEASQPFDPTLVPAETNVDKQPNSADNNDFDQVDPISSQGVTSLDDKVFFFSLIFIWNFFGT